MTTSREAVKSFVLRYFQLLGAWIQEIEEELYRIELDRELAAELEGDTMPAWMWLSGPQQPAQITYYFTFVPEVAEKYSDAELISPGSHRLQQVIESVRKIAQVTRAHLPYVPSREEVAGETIEVRYRPFHVFCLRVEFHAIRPTSQLFCVAVDRVDLLPLRQLGELFPRLDLAPGGPSSDLGLLIEPARASLETSFSIAYNELLEALDRSDPSWARETHASLERERQRLMEYFAECERDGLEILEERERRLAELDGMRPRVFARLQGVCEAYLPVRYVDGSVEHLALLRR